MARAEADEFFDRGVELGRIDGIGDLREAGGLVGWRCVSGMGRHSREQK